MTRRIITVSNQSTGGTAPDDFTARIVKYVPADIIAAWLALVALLSSTDRLHRGVLWGLFFVLLALTPIWTLRVTRAEGRPPARVQAGVSTAAFAVWAFATGPPFTWLSFYDSALGGAAMIVFTAVSAVIVPSSADQPPTG